MNPTPYTHRRLLILFALTLAVATLAIAASKTSVTKSFATSIFSKLTGHAANVKAGAVNKSSDLSAAGTLAPAAPLVFFQGPGVAPTGDPGAGFEIEGDLVKNSPTANTTDWVDGNPPVA